MDIRADYADLDDLDATLDALAEVLDRVLPDAADESLDVRRARALGILADPARAQRLLDQPDQPDQPAPGPHARRGRRHHTVLELRISDLAVLGVDPAGSLAARRAVLADRLAEWCGRDNTDLTVLPVLDPDDHVDAGGYTVPAGLRRLVGARDEHCLFPYCTRAARPADWQCDADHVTPYAAAGRTDSDNIVPLCRHHHRLKTHAGYRAEPVEPGVVRWRTPYRQFFLVDRTGTRPLSPPGPSG
jgi:hypothetical protein